MLAAGSPFCLADRALPRPMRTLFSFQRLRGRRMGIRDGQTGSVTFVRRFGGILNLNPHFHSILPDGLFVPDSATGRLVFAPLPPPTDREVSELSARLSLRLGGIARRQQESREQRLEPAGEEEALVLSSAAEAVVVPLAPMARAGQGADREADRPATPLCSRVDGFSLHAASVAASHDRAALERLCSYGLRPPFSLHRFSLEADGRVRYRLRKPWPTSAGKTDIVLEPLALLRRLAALVPTTAADCAT